MPAQTEKNIERARAAILNDDENTTHIKTRKCHQQHVTCNRERKDDKKIPPPPPPPLPDTKTKKKKLCQKTGVYKILHDRSICFQSHEDSLRPVLKKTRFNWRRPQRTTADEGCAPPGYDASVYGRLTSPTEPSGTQIEPSEVGQ